jgi:putative endonuclease
MWIVYILQCRDSSLYTGITKEFRLIRRVMEHNSGIGSKYTAPRRPVHLMVHSRPMSHSEALKLEAKIKKLPRKKKCVTLLQLYWRKNGS